MEFVQTDHSEILSYFTILAASGGLESFFAKEAIPLETQTLIHFLLKQGVTKMK